MARTFGKMLCTLWDDPDFLNLSADAKVLYSAFFSQPDITAAGVLPWTERRWRRWLNGDRDRVDTAFGELVQERFVLADEDTSEVWLRTFITHDGRLDNSKLATSVRVAVTQIRSQTIAQAVEIQYPSKFPRRRAFDGPSTDDVSPITSDPEGDPAIPDVTDLNQNLEPHHLHSAPDAPSSANNSTLDAEPTIEQRIDTIAEAIARWRARNTHIGSWPKYLASAVPNIVADQGERILELIAIAPYAPVDVIANAVETGDTRGLAMFTIDEPAHLEPVERIDRTRRLELLRANGAAGRLIERPILNVELPGDPA